MEARKIDRRLIKAVFFYRFGCNWIDWSGFYYCQQLHRLNNLHRRWLVIAHIAG